jgi:predicted Zn-dependent peptidase
VSLFSSACVLALVAASGATATPPKPVKPAAPVLAPLPVPEIPFTKMVLANGLTLIVHEDHKAPVVAVNLWYHVGSKDEPPGRTGFAHLFEHLMFGATGGNQRGWFERLEAVGATDINGTTANDRTNFFETVPTPALDMTLAMEAGRMGHLLDNFTEALLNTQRGVVQNEKRQDENEPYAISDELITKSVWPAAHPYSHTVIGEMADLDAAKVADVKDWFSKYYGPTNATLVLAGDITPAEAKAKVENYFGAIPPGPPVPHQKAWIAKRTGAQRAVAQDHVPQARLYIEWNTPPKGAADADMLDLLTDVLTVGKDSRLYKRLIYQDKIATEVAAYTDDREIASLVDVELTAKPGVPLSRLEAAFHEELDRLLRDGPTVAEVERFKTRAIANFVRGAERVGGFGGKSDILAENQTYFGDPGAWKTRLDRIRAATPEALAAAGRRWLTDGSFTLEITPVGDYAPVPGAVTATEIPAAGPPLAPHFPKVQIATLANGLNVVVAERHETPTVAFDLVLPAGSAADPQGLRGLAQLDARTMADGTTELDALAFDDRKIALGVTLGARAALDTTYVSMSALSNRLSPSLDLFADLILRPALRSYDVDREKALITAEIAQAKDDPVEEALRLSFPLTYGRDNPYGAIANEASIAKLTPADVLSHHKTWFQPRGATLVIAGDTTLEAVLPLIQARFGGWAPTDIKAPTPAQPTLRPTPDTIYLVDKPGALQSVILAAAVAPPKLNPDDIAIQAMITSLGGAFTSRLNMNLREDKHWAYGAFAFIQDAKGPSLLDVLAPVQTDKTKDSFAEVQRELNDVVGARPLTPHELELSQHNLTLSLPGRWETANAVAGSLAEIAAYNLPADYYDAYAQHVSALTLADEQRAAATVVRPGALTWIVVGDKAKVLAPLQSLGLKVKLIDSDGKPVEYARAVGSEGVRAVP